MEFFAFFFVFFGTWDKEHRFNCENHRRSINWVYMCCLTKYLKKIWKLISLDAYKFLYILFYLYFSLFIDFVTFYSSSVDLSYVVIYYRLISSGLLNKLLRCSNLSTILLQNIYTLSDIYYYVYSIRFINRKRYFVTFVIRLIIRIRKKIRDSKLHCSWQRTMRQGCLCP